MDVQRTISAALTPGILVLPFQEHIDEVEAETRDGLEKATVKFAAILRRMQALSPDDCIPGAVKLISLGFPERGRQLAEQILQSSSVLDDHPDDILKAYHRVTLANPPATKARQSVKDCHIIESYFRLAANLRSAGFSRNIVFTSSNTKDYQQDHPSLHPALRAEFESACLKYSPNWSATRHELDHRRTPSPAPTPA